MRELDPHATTKAQCSQTKMETLKKKLSRDVKATGFRADDGKDYQYNIGYLPIKC